MAEQLALEQIARDCAAVDCPKRPVFALAEIVDCSRHQFLAGTALSGHQDDGIGGGDSRDQVVDLLHRIGSADKPSEPAELAQFAAQSIDLLAQVEVAVDVPQHVAQALEVDRLDQIVGHSLAQGDDRGVDRRVTGDQYDIRRRGLVEVFEQLQAVTVRQLEVEQDDVGTTIAQRVARFGQRADAGRVEAFALDDRPEGVEGLRVVVYKKRARHRRKCNR